MVQGMTEAEAKRQQQRRAWDAEHLHSIGTKLTPVELARLDAYCFRIRTTRYSLLRTLVLEELAAYERENRVTLDAPCAATETVAERDDTHGLQIHHIVHRSVGGNDTPCNLITLCWRCHAEAHGTWVAERHAVRPPHTAEERYAAYRMLQDEYEQLCVEYVSDYYAERGEEWWPYK